MTWFRERKMGKTEAIARKHVAGGETMKGRSASTKFGTMSEKLEF